MPPSLLFREGRLWMQGKQKEEFVSNFTFRVVGHYAKPMPSDASKIDQGYIFRVKLCAAEGGDHWKVAVKNKDLSSGKDFFEKICDNRTSLSLFVSHSKYGLLVDFVKTMVKAYADPEKRDKRKEYLVAENIGIVEACDGDLKRYMHVTCNEHGTITLFNEAGTISQMPVILRLNRTPKDIGVTGNFDAERQTDLLAFVNNMRRLFKTNEPQVLIAVGWMAFSLSSEIEKNLDWNLKALLSLVGEPSTGKTTLAELLLTMVGAKNSCRDYTPTSLLARTEASSVPCCLNDYHLCEAELEKLKHVVVSIAEGKPRDSQRCKVYPIGSAILTSNTLASALHFDRQSGIMTRSVVLPIHRPTQHEVEEFAREKASLVAQLHVSDLYRELVELRYQFRYGGDMEKVKERVITMFKGLFNGTWSRLWPVYEPSLCLCYYLLRRLGEKKLMRKLVLPFVQNEIIPMLRPPTVLELLARVKLHLLEMTDEMRSIEVRHFLKLTNKLTAVKNRDVLLIAYNRADLFLKDVGGEENAFQDLIKHRQSDVHVVESRQHFPKEKSGFLLPRTRDLAASQMYQLVHSMFEIADFVDQQLIEIVKDAWSLETAHDEEGSRLPIPETPRAHLANNMRRMELNNGENEPADDRRLRRRQHKAEKQRLEEEQREAPEVEEQREDDAQRLDDLVEEQRPAEEPRLVGMEDGEKEPADDRRLRRRQHKAEKHRLEEEQREALEVEEQRKVGEQPLAEKHDDDNAEPRDDNLVVLVEEQPKEDELRPAEVRERQQGDLAEEQAINVGEKNLPKNRGHKKVVVLKQYSLRKRL